MTAYPGFDNHEIHPKGANIVKLASSKSIKDTESFIDSINTMVDEESIKNIINSASLRLEFIKKQKEIANKADFEEKYKGKYLLIYGKHLSLNSMSEKNEKDISIVYVNDLNFKGRGFYSCDAKIIHITYDSDSEIIKHISSDNFGSVMITCEHDSQYQLYDYEIEKILTKEEAVKIIADAKQDVNDLIEGWNNI